MGKVVSNRICISFIEDGKNVHGALAAAGSLSQGWDKNTNEAVPNWDSGNNDGAGTADSPVIYLELTLGSAPKAVSGNAKTGVTWTHNGVALEFDANDLNSNTDTAEAGTFKRTTQMVGPTGSQIAMPALKIVKNLASAGNLNLDKVGIIGSVELGGVLVDFSDDITIPIAELSGSGYLGALVFANQKATLDGDTDSVTATAKLFKAGGEVTSVFTVEFQVNGMTLTGTSAGNYAVADKAITLYGLYVIDIATITAIFRVNNEIVATAIESVNDIRDKEYMWIQYTVTGGLGRNDDPDVTLREGQTVTYGFWMATSDNIENIDEDFTIFEFQPRKAGSDGALLTVAECNSAGLTGTKYKMVGGQLVATTTDSDTVYWVDVTATSTVKTPGNATITKAGQFAISYNTATRTAFGSGVSGLVRARTAS